MTRRNFEYQVQNAFDGGNVDTSAIREKLLEDPEAIKIWCDYALMDAELRRHTQSRLKIPGSASAQAEILRRIRQRNQALIAGFAAAAVILLLAVALHFFVVKPKQWSAHLTLSPGSQILSGSGTIPSGGTIGKDMPLTLSQGVAKLDLPNGVVAVIEGPASFQLIGKNAATLENGHAWFHVPPGAEGFTIRTPSMEITDLGTEFGIDLREGLPPSVHVLSGKVEVFSKIGSRAKIPITQGNAFSQSPAGHWQPLPNPSPHFRTSLPPALPELRMNFEEILDGNLAIEGDILDSRNAVAKLHGNARIVPGIDGMALEFDGSPAWIETNWPGISGTAARTVSLWCKIPPGTRHLTTPPFALWGNPTENRKFKVAPRTDQHGNTVLRASFGEYLIDGQTEIADGEWHHLAVVYHGNAPDGEPIVTLYVNGNDEPVTRHGDATGSISTDTHPSRYGMTIGRYELAARSRNPYLRATIDSLHIRAGVLSPEEIRRLADRS